MGIDESWKEGVAGEIDPPGLLGRFANRNEGVNFPFQYLDGQARPGDSCNCVDDAIGHEEKGRVHVSKLAGLPRAGPARNSRIELWIERNQEPRLGVFERVADSNHEQIVFNFDEPSGLRAIIAIHSTALGPALGGTRFFPYESEEQALEDVLRLSRGMTYKAAAAGLDLGGGKAVIIGDPAWDKTERMFRAYGRGIDSLNGRYITAEDVGTTAEDMELIRRETRWALGTSVVEGGSGDPSPATARGLVAALRAVVGFLWGDSSLEGRRVAVQGVGKVGYAYARLLVEERAEVIVADTNETTAERAVADLGVKAVANNDIFSVDCDVFSPCALGAIFNAETIPRLACQAVVGSANNQLATPGDAEDLDRRGILYAPDFVVNAGGLINVYEELRGYSKVRAMHRVDNLQQATTHILQTAQQLGVIPLIAAERVAEERIAAVGDLRRWYRPSPSVLA